MVMGVAAELAFIKDTLDKVGITADFISVGKYKSAPEQYTRADPSAPNREMTESIVSSRYEDLVAMVADSRHVAPDVARAWIDDGLFDAPTALAQGLVDTLVTADALIEALFPDDEASDFADYVAARPPAPRHAPVVALIHAAGDHHARRIRRRAAAGAHPGQRHARRATARRPARTRRSRPSSCASTAPAAAFRQATSSGRRSSGSAKPSRSS